MSKRTKKGLLRPDAGVATINLVTLIPAFIVITWMAAEVGMALRLVGIARDAAESVALAAAARYRDGFDAATLDGTTAALGYTAGGRPLVVDFGSRMNGGTDVAFGRWDPATRAFSVDTDGGPAVRVRVRFGDDHPNGSVGLLLPGLFGTGPFSFERTAVAVYVPPRHTTSLRIEGTGADTLRLGDTARLVSYGGVSVLSGSARAVNIGIGPEVEASVLRLGGSLPEPAADAIDAAVEESVTFVVEPHADDALPTITGTPGTVAVDPVGTTRLAPGVHGAVNFTAGLLILEAGLHQFVGGFEVGGTAQVILENATMQLADGTTMVLSDQASIKGTPMTGLVGLETCWFLHRGISTRIECSGRSVVEVDGRFYAPNVQVALRDAATWDIASAVVEGVEGFGTSRFSLEGKIDALDTTPLAGRARLVR